MMGAQDRFGFTVVIEDVEGLTNKIRLQVAVSRDGSLGGGPSHFWCDVHSHYDEVEGKWVLDDDPIDERDAKAVRMIQRLAQVAEWGPNVDLELLGSAFDAVTTAAWGAAVCARIKWALTSGGNPAEQGPAMQALVALEGAKGAALGVVP